MKVEYTLTVTALCPVDNLPDVYEVLLRTSHTIQVEKILAVTAAFTSERLFQEDLTQRIHRALACEVESVGYHSGVLTRVVCGAK